MTKEEIKSKLLTIGCFEENEWFNKYIDILIMDKFPDKYNRFEYHHVFPVSNLNYAIDNNLILNCDINFFKKYTKYMPKAYHILSHLYIARCCKYDYMKDQNYYAVRMMINDKSIKFSEINSIEDLNNLSIDEINYWSDERRNEQALIFKKNITIWRKEHPDEYSLLQHNASQGNIGSRRTEQQKINIAQSRIKYFDTHEAYLYNKNKYNCESCLKISNKALGHIVSDSTKNKLSEFVSNSTNITNGINNLRCDKNNTDYYKQFGYKVGTTKNLDKNRKLITITNNIINHAVTCDELYLWDNGDWFIGDRRRSRRTLINEFIEKGFKRC